MELLVSVRLGEEVEAALRGGADIIDAKEPAHGPMGPVSATVLGEILGRTPGDQALSVALGDFTDPDAVETAISSVALSPRLAPLYLKLGFAGVAAGDRLEAMIARAVAAAERHPASPRIVVVAYADGVQAGWVSPQALRDSAARQGAVGVLLDTSIKDGRGLLGSMDRISLEHWVARGKSAGLLTALAGELKLQDIAWIQRADPDVIGVRGAACDGGRGGLVNPSRVQALHERIRVRDPFRRAVSPMGHSGWRNA
jgi:(5-formylfuran-3-yl)methyl phosphate synthase